MLNLDEEIVVKYIDDDEDEDDDVVVVGPLIEQFQLEGQSPTGLHCA